MEFEVMLRPKLKKLLYPLVMLTLVALGNPYALAAGGICKVEFLGNKLTVDVDNAPLGALLIKIQEKTGVRFTLNEGESKKIVSLAFQGLPLDTAIRRILRTSNYAMVFRPDGALEKVIVTGQGSKRWSLADNEMYEAPGTLRPVAKASGSQEAKNATYAPVDLPARVATPQRNSLEKVTDSKVPGSPTAGEMQITGPSDQMVIQSRPDVKMQITHASTPMIIEEWDGKRMNITYPQNQNVPK